jgi:hypothetical protein
MQFHLAIDFAQYPPHRQEALQRQQKCILEILRTLPLETWESVIRCSCPFEHPQFIPWARDGFGEASDKHVPYLHDIFDELALRAHENALIGYINSDNYPAPHLWSSIAKQAREGAQAIILHRTDVLEGELRRVIETPGALAALPNNKNFGKRVSRGISCDGVFFKRSFWEDEVTPRYPDFVTGEPWWDTAMIYLLHWLEKVKSSHVVSLSDNVLLHVKHPIGWNGNSPGAQRAKALYVQMKKELNP